MAKERNRGPDDRIEEEKKDGEATEAWAASVLLL